MAAREADQKVREAALAEAERQHRSAINELRHMLGVTREDSYIAGVSDERARIRQAVEALSMNRPAIKDAVLSIIDGEQK